MKFTPTTLEGSFVIDPGIFEDERGWFTRYYCKKEFSAIGHDKEWVQMNQSFNNKKGTLRGMHFQRVPFAEIKLVKCVSGSVWDVVIDLRRQSSTFLQSFAIELSAANGRMIYIPEGFAHGFQTLEDNSSLLYHHSSYYEPGKEGSLRYNDPALNLNWPLEVTVISKKDAGHPLIDEQFNPGL
jgi:dTDP-4-dehydrorhamnose 3,5-epimerase